MILLSRSLESSGRDKCPSCTERNKDKITAMADVGQESYLEPKEHITGESDMIRDREMTVVLKSEDRVGVTKPRGEKKEGQMEQHRQRSSG